MTITAPETLADWLDVVWKTAIAIGACWAALKGLPMALRAWREKQNKNDEFRDGLKTVVKGWGPLTAAVQKLTDDLAKVSDLPRAFSQLSAEVVKFKGDWQADGESKPLAILKDNSRHLAALTIQQGQQTAMLRGIVETINEAVVWTDPQGEPVMVTRGFTTLTGLDLAGMLNGGWKRMIHPDDLENVCCAWDRAKINGDSFVKEFRIHNIHHPERGYLKVYNIAMPIPDRAGWMSVFTKTADRMSNSPINMPTNVPIFERAE